MKNSVYFDFFILNDVKNKIILKNQDAITKPF